MADKPDKDTLRDFDPIDLQIIGIRRDRPRATVREIASAVGLGKSAVWKRLRRIGESDYIKLCRAELADMLPLAQRAYLASLRNPDKQLEAASKLFAGLGVFANRNEHSGPDGGPIRAEVVIYIPDNGRDDTNGDPDPATAG